MASDPAVQPLRISKTTPSNSPQKAQSRPLAEIGAGSQRRNSPSYNQATRKMIVSRDSLSFNGAENSSPLSPACTEKKSPRNFWSQQDRENNMMPSRFDGESSILSRSPSPGVSPRRRPSVEQLLNAGRVKGSNIFALETKDMYDPAAVPIIERPSANRPLSQQLANNSFHRFDSLRKENNPLRSADNSPARCAASNNESGSTTASPEKDRLSRMSPSPTKSSLAKMSMFGAAATQFDPENGTWSDEDGENRAPTPKARLHRHNKSVTFGDETSMYEYEEQTPEPSVEAASREGSWDSEEMEEQYHDYSFERGSSAEVGMNDSFDEDLENADKTPVVLPEQWRQMSPSAARRDLVDDGDDVFEGSPNPPSRPVLGRSESVASDGSNRPLPPLPGLSTGRRDSTSLAEAAERASRLSLGLPKPPKRASCSKDEIRRLSKQSSTMLYERAQLDKERTASDAKFEHGSVHETQGEFIVKNLDTGEKIDISVHETEVQDDSMLQDLHDFAAPRISRESILRKVRDTKYDFEDDSDCEADQSELVDDTRPSYAELAKYDPDQPIPSRENSRETSEAYASRNEYNGDVSEVAIKAEPADEDAMDMAAIPEAPRSPSRMDDFETSVLVHTREEDDDSNSRYSTAEPELEQSVVGQREPSPMEDGKETLDQAMGLLSVRDYAAQICKPAPKSIAQQESSKPYGSFMGLPAYLSTDDYDFGMKEYITPSPPQTAMREIQDPMENIKTTPDQSFTKPETPLEPPNAPFTNVDQDSQRGTPDSVIHNPSSDDIYDQDSEPVSPVEEKQVLPEHDDEPVSPILEPEIPERRSTIKTSGKLKTRPSASRTELEDIRAQMEAEDAQQEPVPRLPDAYQTHVEGNDDSGSTHSGHSKVDSLVSEQQSETQQATNLNIDIPAFDGNVAEDLEDAFDRVIESQKKGYLMRQNTKVVVASNRNFSNETANSIGSHSRPMSPTSGDARPVSKGGKGSVRKPSAEQWMKTEPWNGKARRKSQRNASAQTGVYAPGPAPPLPGQESALGIVDEDYATQATGSLDGEVADGVERGRLFVKVVGVKDLALPMPRNDRIYFQLTLDNGLHCVTTSNLELGKNAPIGQEFELVVLNDLDFQLTLTTKLPPRSKRPEDSVPRPRSPQKQKPSTFQKLLSSPKKRAERERQEREAQEAEERRYQEEVRRKRASVQPTTWDLLHDLVNSADGAFARSYVNLAAHEKDCFGRQLTVDIPCYNEWALEKDQAVVSSVRSKGRGRCGEVKKPPYVVGKLEVQLVYVPKPKGFDDEAMPKSMNAALREINRASEKVEVCHEGHLSQQGGDCTHWRRRFFRLQGAKLTAYHEHTHQKRAVINLSKASRLVDDKRTLVADQKSFASPSKPGGRRKSGFAEEDEGYQYVEEGFRIRFTNGETIDFYADSAAKKEEWMQVLAQMIGKPDLGRKKASWTDVVLARERKLGGGSSPLTGSSSPLKQDAPATPSTTASKGPQRTLSIDRKPVPPTRGPGHGKTKSASTNTSPVKQGPPPAHAAPDPPFASSGATEGRSSMAVGRERPRSYVRPGTPPMEPRRGHRSRDAVKSMIF